MNVKGNLTTMIGVYSEQYKGGPVLQTNDSVVYLLNFPQNSSYEGKRLEVIGVVETDTSHTVGPYQPGQPISQGWEGPRTVMDVKSFKILE
ncbi:MAG: hypothetical protein ABH842_00355 [Candidatus Micrarchaeota archaeon]